MNYKYLSKEDYRVVAAAAVEVLNSWSYMASLSKRKFLIGKKNPSSEILRYETMI